MNEEIVVTPENIAEVLLSDKRFSSCPSISRLCTEAFILSMSGDKRGLARVASEAYGSLSDKVLAEIRSTTGVSVRPNRRRTKRTMDVSRHASDLLGVQIDAGAGLRAFSSACLWRDEDGIKILFAN